MNFKMNKKIFSTLLLVVISLVVFSQQIDVNSMTKDDVLNMSYDELLELPFETVLKLADIVGVTMDELYEMILNKNIVSASKSEESSFDAPLSTSVVSHDEIVNSGATSIEDALRLVPGVIVREKTNGVYDVQIRGGQNIPMNNLLIYSENTTTLVMIDGRPVFNYGMGGILWETLPVSLGEIDRIEVVRGPSSALYGPNAVNGVINIITSKVDKSSPLVTANFQGGSQSTYIADLSLRKSFNKKLSAGVAGYFEQRSRNTDKIYATYDDEYIDLDTYDQRNTDSLWSNDNAYELFIDAQRSKQKIGINGFVNLNLNKDANFSLNGGYLDAQAISSTVGDGPTPYNQRVSGGYYTNFLGSFYGFSFQAAMNNVIQDFNKSHKGWKQATEQYNLSLDYLFEFDKLSIRPGISYQSVYYDDHDYIDSIGDGYFNDRVALRNYAVSARFDYKPIEKVRLVAALRAEKYNVPDKWKPSYQFIGTYKINDNNLFRAVYSRANQSTFMINAFSNYTWDLSGTSSGVDYVHFAGTDDPDLMTMDMIELGYRIRPIKKLMIDIEGFYNMGKDYSALMPDSMRTVTFVGDQTLDWANGEYTQTTLYTSHRSLDIKSKQIGFTINADMVISEKLVLEAHATWQQTQVTDFMDMSRNDVAALQVSQYQSQMTSDITNYLYYVATGGAMGSPTPPNASYSSDVQPDKSTYKDMEDEAMPSFWGSIGITYKPTKKWSAFVQGYYYSSSYMYTQYANSSSRPDNCEYTGNIEAKFLINAKVSYQLTKNINLFVNGRNILNNEKQEFMFMDKIGALYLAGLNVNF